MGQSSNGDAKDRRRLSKVRLRGTANSSFFSFGTDSRWRRRRLLTEWMDIIHGGGAILRNNVIRIAEKETGGSTTYGVVPDIYQRVNVFVWTKLTFCGGKNIRKCICHFWRTPFKSNSNELSSGLKNKLFFWSTSSNRFGNPSHFKD